jgi:hypothetical protein
VQSLWWQAHSKDTKKAAQASFQVCTLRVVRLLAF